jgi:hypothetical protein
MGRGECRGVGEVLAGMTENYGPQLIPFLELLVRYWLPRGCVDHYGRLLYVVYLCTSKSKYQTNCPWKNSLHSGFVFLLKTQVKYLLIWVNFRILAQVFR